MGRHFIGLAVQFFGELEEVGLKLIAVTWRGQRRERSHHAKPIRFDFLAQRLEGKAQRHQRIIFDGEERDELSHFMRCLLRA